MPIGLGIFSAWRGSQRHASAQRLSLQIIIPMSGSPRPCVLFVDVFGSKDERPVDDDCGIGLEGLLFSALGIRPGARKASKPRSPGRKYRCSNWLVAFGLANGSKVPGRCTFRYFAITSTCRSRVVHCGIEVPMVLVGRFDARVAFRVAETDIHLEGAGLVEDRFHSGGFRRVDQRRARSRIRVPGDR